MLDAVGRQTVSVRRQAPVPRISPIGAWIDLHTAPLLLIAHNMQTPLRAP
jgi:hypothetical protein